MAGIFHGLGSDSHLFFRGETVLRRGFDPFIVETLMNELTAHGPELHKNSTPTELIKQKDGTISVKTADGKQHDGFVRCALVGRSLLSMMPLVLAPARLKRAGV
jgi:glutathione reductase (NADPH)